MSLINENSVVQISGDSYTVDGAYITPTPGNTQYEEVLAWIAAGNTPKAEGVTELTKAGKLREVYDCALQEARKHIPEIEHHSTLAAIGIICNNIDMTSATTQLKTVRDIATYKHAKAEEIKGDASDAFVDYDPTTDNNWPQ